MKCALICYHRKAETIYPTKWIDEFRHSILNQTYKEFDIIEMNYGDDSFEIFAGAKEVHRYSFPNFVHAMNWLLDRCFNELGYDYVLNTNSDDVFALNRVEKQVQQMGFGFDIISSNFSLIQEGTVVLTHQFDELDIEKELEKNHNILCHPVIAMSHRFWRKNRYDPDQIPYEDMMLWKRGLAGGFHFKILPDVLCFHRLHNNSVGHNLKEA